MKKLCNYSTEVSQFLYGCPGLLESFVCINSYRHTGRDCRTNPPGADWHSSEGCRARQPGMSPEAMNGEGSSTSLCPGSRQSLPGWRLSLYATVLY